MPHWSLAGLVASAVAAAPAAAAPPDVAGRVHAEGVLHCGGAIHPGLLFPTPGGSWHGLEADICRAVATAVLGAGARFEIHAYALPQSYDRLRDGADELAFLTASEILAGQLLPVIVPGRTVFFATSTVLVPAASPVQHIADLADRPICGEPGTGAERALVAWFANHHLPLQLFPFQEAEEMLDAYDVGRCDAMVGETTSLAAIALQAAADGRPSRLLPDAIAAVPVMASTGRSDPGWSAIVAWAVDTLQGAAMPDEPGAEVSLNLPGAALGLAPDWQAQMLRAVGSYAAIYRRNLGADSPLGLPPGLNALWTDGGLICPPYAE